jgi:hypothetical protein
MIGEFSTGSLDTYKKLVSGVHGNNFSENETYDFTRCVRPNGTAYGTKGKCHKGREQAADVKESRGLFNKEGDMDFAAVEAAAETWRKKAGLDAAPLTLTWKHDMVHVLVHNFLGGSGKIGSWIGEGSKSPTVAEETLVNMIHRASALRGRGYDYSLTDRDLNIYFTRDISFMLSRGDISPQIKSLYYKDNESGVNTPDVKKFITKYREMEKAPGFDKLLNAAHRSFTNAGEYFL